MQTSSLFFQTSGDVKTIARAPLDFFGQCRFARCVWCVWSSRIQERLRRDRRLLSGNLDFVLDVSCAGAGGGSAQRSGATRNLSMSKNFLRKFFDVASSN